MKTLLRDCWRTTAAGLFAGALGWAASVSAQTPNPVGTWDVVLHGDQKGVAHFTFYDDYTLDGREVVNYVPKAKADPDSDLRGGGSGGPRVTPPGSTNNPARFFGGAPVQGVWSPSDTRGGLVGMYVELGGSSEITNYVSFRGKVTGANRLNLVAHHGNRKYQLRGIHQTVLPDITGRYYLSGKRDYNSYIRVFDVAADPYATLPNQYLVTPADPLYAGSPNGVLLLSGQGQIGIASLEWTGTNDQGDNPDELILFSLSGAYNVVKGKGNITGVSDLDERVVTKIIKVAEPDSESE